MTSTHSNRKLWILILILFMGLGMALALPALAQAGHSAGGDQLPSAAAATTFHVAKTGDGSDGLDWTKAFTNVQAALAAASSGDEIWVATGVYTPGTALTNTFTLTSGVELYGGFVATETLRAQRDWVANPTVLSHDIGGDDVTDAGVVTTATNIVGSNSYHVVTGSGVTTTARLDGFTITAGQADGSGDNRYGGGMYNHSGSPTLANVTFSGNLAEDYGGGMYNESSNPVLTDVTFSSNSTTRGGGMFNLSSSPALTDVTFSGNSAEDNGGGKANSASLARQLIFIVGKANDLDPTDQFGK